MEWPIIIPATFHNTANLLFLQHNGRSDPLLSRKKNLPRNPAFDPHGKTERQADQDAASCLGITQENLAKAVKMSVSTITRFERNKGDAKASTLYDIAKVLKCRMEDSPPRLA